MQANIQVANKNTVNLKIDMLEIYNYANLSPIYKFFANNFSVRFSRKVDKISINTVTNFCQMFSTADIFELSTFFDTLCIK